MQREFSDNFSKLSQVVIKPAVKLAELNVNTMNEYLNSFERIAKARKPEEIFSAQSEFLNATVAEMSKYAQRAVNIGLEAVSEANKIWMDMVRETSSKASDMANKNMKMREQEKE